MLDEVQGAELAVLNTNNGYGQVFERIMRVWEETLRQEVVEALWQDGEQHTGEADEADADSANAAVRRFEQAIDAARKLCADSKEVRDRVVEMGRVKMLLTVSWTWISDTSSSGDSTGSLSSSRSVSGG